MKQKKELKPVDILLKICLKRLHEMGISCYEINKDLEAEIKIPNTRYRAKQRIKKLIDEIKKESVKKGISKTF
jgi:hypothetical protein